MSKTVYNDDQVRRTFEAMRDMLDRCEKDAIDVLARHPRQSLDGYPTNTGSDKGGRGSGHADPTYSVTVNILAGAPAGSIVEQFFGHVHMATIELERADSLRAQAIPPERDKIDLSMWCEECMKVRVDPEGGDHTFCIEPVHKDGARICQWHYRYRKSEGVWPPPSLVRKHHKGERITQADVDEAKGRKAS